jgi:hypothetical protein
MISTPSRFRISAMAGPAFMLRSSRYQLADINRRRRGRREAV